MNSPKVSICMPMYNASRYLRECIDSVLAQTFTDFEFLIADDGSTDNSAEIVESYSDPRIRLIRRPHDYIATLNCLLDEARGKYIARMDADDVMLPNRLQLQVDYMNTNPVVDVLGGEVLNYGDTQTAVEQELNSQIITIRGLVEANQLNHPTVMLRVKTIRELGLHYSQDHVYAEDYQLWSEFVRNRRKIVSLNLPVIYYRVHSEQISNQRAALQRQTHERIKQENRLYAVRHANETYVAPTISPSGNKLTVIIPFLNEGQEVVNTVASVREFAKDSVDILVINDCSYDGVDYGKLLKPYNVYYLVNFENLGVAASRDLGISICKTPYFLLLDAHMRFYESECFDTICRLLTENDRRLLCCQSTAIDPDPTSGMLLPRANYKLAFGAYSPYDMSSLWPDIKWNNYEKFSGYDIEPIELVLGAGYAASTRYWIYLKGLYGLRGYGFDEAYISIKVWMEGGECLLLKQHILGHLYRGASPYFTSNYNMIYNSLLISTLLMSRNYRNWSYAIALNKDYDKSIAVIAQIRDNKELRVIKAYYDSIFSNPYDIIVTKHLKSQAPLYAELNERINSVFNDYLSWLKSEPQNMGLGLKDGGLSSVLLYIALDKRNSGLSGSSRINRIIQQLEQSLFIEKLDYSFDRGLCGIGWLLIGMHRYGILSEIPSHIIRMIDLCLEDIDLDTIAFDDFDNGIGALLSYGCARLYAMDYLEDNTHFVSSEKLMTLRDVALKALLTPKCDSRTYYHALEFLDAISLEIDEYKWSPNLYDVVFCSEKPILDINQGGYDLYSGVMRNWAFATIHQIKTNQV